MIWLDNSRILAIFCVVFLHVSAGVVLGNDVGTEYWWVGNVYDSSVRWCVPVFVMISGALLLDPNKQEDVATFYTKRLSRILVPIIFWSAFFLAWNFLKFAMKGGEPLIVDLLKSLLSGMPHYHMWFLYMIISLYLFTPFFRKIVTHSSKDDLLVFIAIAFVMAMLNYAYSKFISGESKLFINWFLLYVPFFFLGHLIRQDNRNPRKSILWSTFIVSIIVTFYGCYFFAENSSLEYGLYFYGYLSVSVIPMSISLMYILKALDKPIINTYFTKKLSILTLGIYLVHPVILETIDYIQYGTRSLHPIVSVPVVSCIVFVISAGIAYVIYRTPFIRRII